MKTYQKIAQAFDAYLASQSRGSYWVCLHQGVIENIMKDSPHGSGLDSETTLDEDNSTKDKLVFHTGFHHMSDVGYYDGWTEHDVIITPSLAFLFNIKVTGQNRNDIKDYIGEVFHCWLDSEIE